jgi:integrase
MGRTESGTSASIAPGVYVIRDPKSGKAHLSIAVPRAPGQKRAVPFRPSLGVPWVDLTSADSATAGARRALTALAKDRYEQFVREGRVVRISGLAADGERVRAPVGLIEALTIFVDETKSAHPEKGSAREGYAYKLAAFAEDRVFADDWKTVRYWKEGDPPLTPLPLWKGDKRPPFVRLVSDDACERYMNHRLSRAVPQTVRLEINFLTAFHEWLKNRGWISALPVRCSVKKKAKGTRTGVQRERAVQFDEEENIDILMNLPMFNQRGGRRLGPDQNGPKSFRVRDPLLLKQEAALRPGHVEQIVLGRHWTIGSDTLVITPDIDKSADGYTRKLTPTGLEILERVCREDIDKILARGGLIFGRHSHRSVIKNAACKVLGEERGKDAAPYDFRHAAGRETMQATGGDLGAVQAAMHHTSSSTTVRYLQKNEERGDAALLAASELRRARAAARGIDLSQETGRAVAWSKRAKGRKAPKPTEAIAVVAEAPVVETAPSIPTAPATVEEKLAEAIATAAAELRWDIVTDLSRQLEARRLAAVGGPHLHVVGARAPAGGKEGR